MISATAPAAACSHPLSIPDIYLFHLWPNTKTSQACLVRWHKSVGCAVCKTSIKTLPTPCLFILLLYIYDKAFNSNYPQMQSITKQKMSTHLYVQNLTTEASANQLRGWMTRRPIRTFKHSRKRPSSSSIELRLRWLSNYLASQC